MSDNAIARLLGDPGKAGVFRVNADPCPSVDSAAIGLGFAFRTIDLANAATKELLLRDVALALAFPDWFGGNWDALADCLTDLSWLPASGYVVMIKNCGRYRGRDPQGFGIVMDIFAEAARFWRAHGIAFWTLVELPRDADSSLARLPFP